MAEGKDKAEKKEVKKTGYTVEQIATQTEPIIVDNDTGEQLDLHAAMVLLLNQQKELMKTITE